uniref:Uncharacterized protein MANES_15G171800 n=1 Tax=Rhizophora mucronata TaxID=61149 RepID=A0A2P2LN05_RHIMU
MLRQVSRLLGRPIAAQQQVKMLAGRAFFSTDVPATPTEDSTFVESWKKLIPNIEPPKTPSAFMKPRPPPPSSIPSKLTVNFVLPYESVLSGKEVRVYGPRCAFLWSFMIWVLIGYGGFCDI